MDIKEVMSLVEKAKADGKDEIIVAGKLDDGIVRKLCEEHDACIFYSYEKLLDETNMETIVSWDEEKLAMSKWAEELGNVWYYSVIYHDDTKYPYYGLHEVMPKKDGTIDMWTALPSVTGHDVDEIRDALQYMLDDVNSKPILKIVDKKLEEK